MADAAYKEWPFIFSSRGIQARNVDDAVPPAFYLNLDNCEELFESSFSQKLGSTIINRSGTTPFPLTGTPISLGKLAGLSGSAWRYAATTAGKLYRRTGLTAGAYSLISSAVSGSPMTMASYRPDISSFPTIFFADANGMLKDNGTYTAPEQMGIFQPRYPCIAQSQLPSSITFDNYTSIGGFVFVPSSGLGQAIVAAVNTTLTSAVIVIGLQPVSVADPTQIQLFQLLTIGAETVLVLLVTPTGFVAVFTNGHTIGTAVTSQALTVTVPQSTTATISKPFGFDPIATWPKVLSQSDYIGIQIYIGDPQQIQSITIKFDCGDGSFNSDYFWKVIAQGPEQQLLNTVNDPAVAATDAILSNSIGVYNNAEGGVAPLATGLNVWNPFLFQLSDFSGAGRADFNDPVFNWQNVNGYQIQIETNDQASTVVSLAALILEGGSGPDSFAGVGYDYMFTFYNANDGAESNPSTEMSDINPPISTTLVYPRRQPVKVSLTWGTGTVPITVDPQVTHLRIYRRGGTLGDNFRRVDEVPITGGNFGQVYIDTASDADIQASDFISLTNDVPVTSTLPVPVNTTLTSPLTPSLPFNASLVSVVSTANMSVGQQFTIGSPTAIANNFEIAIVLFVASSTTFYAFIQNNHSSGESVQATARVGQPVTLMALAYTQMYFAGDPNNPHFLYFSNATNPQAVGSASYIEVGSPDNPITVIANFKGTLYVSTKTAWWLIAPGTNSKPTPYPTAAKHGCVAPFGYTITEEGIYYQAIDGMRFFAGGASQYLTQDIEFIFQGVGTTPIVEADQSQLSKTVMAWWNNMIFVSYVGLDANRHRLILHTIYKRWRNDDIDAQSILIEEDIGQLLYGNSQGYVYLDRQDVPADEVVSGGVIVPGTTSINLQTPYQNQEMPDIQKNYVELTLDVNTQGQTLTPTLIFDDGAFSVTLPTFSNAARGKINFNLNFGKGYTYYKVSLQITGTLSQFAYIYQCSIKGYPIAKTRLTFDTYKLECGIEDSKFAKNSVYDYDSTQPIDVSVFYDDAATPGFTFTLPSTSGARSTMRQRLPAPTFRLIRFVGTSTADFRLWSAKLEVKPLAAGKGYQVIEFTPN